MEAQTQRAPSRVSMNPAHYLRASYQRREAAKDIHELTGFKLPDYPKLIIYNVPGNGTIAQVYKDKLIIWDPVSGIGREVMHHELYHHAQERAREQAGEIESERKFLMRAESKGQSEVDRLSALWNGINEAGAYFFGFYSIHSDATTKEELARRIFDSFEKHCGIHISAVQKRVIDVIFGRDGKPFEASGLSNLEDFRKYHSSINTLKVQIATVITAIMLEQNNLDVVKTARDLLFAPEKTLNRVVALGYDGAYASLERIEKLLQI